MVKPLTLCFQYVFQCSIISGSHSRSVAINIRYSTCLFQYYDLKRLISMQSVVYIFEFLFDIYFG